MGIHVVRTSEPRERFDTGVQKTDAYLTRDYGCLTYASMSVIRCFSSKKCFRFLYADPTPNALQVFLPQHGILDDAATMPIPADAATSGLAPSAASLLLKESSGQTEDNDIIMHEPDEEATGEQEGVWISADPKPGCVVCNIGESMSSILLVDEMTSYLWS